MNTPNQDTTETTTAQSKPNGNQKQPAKTRTVHSCNFRSAGRLSNEDARALTAIHETFAFHLSGALDTYLGVGVEVKLETLDQLPIKEHIAEITPLSYIVPFSSNTIIMELDNELVFPMIELLMGGTGIEKGIVRDLSEIEGEIMQDVVALFARQAQAVWKIPNLTLVPGSRMKPALLNQSFALSEKATILKFGIEVAGTTGSFKFVFPTEFLNVLMAQIKLSQPQKKSRVWSFPAPPLRERILDCDFEVSSELPSLKVLVRDLIALQPGSVLKLRAPIRNPGMLTAGGRSLFEAVPVRNGTQRAAQLGRRLSSTEWKGI
ncbi:MAG TPA: FliM/FliN family flagellar motor switch protein [Terracidiphilus sp.]|nr:FliM/FliN family flagellar motor switch protein [Terracidiphilus sp.]